MENSQKQKFVSEIVAGEKLDEIFMLSEKNLANKRDGKPYLSVTLADRSGRLKGVVWDNVDSISAAAHVGDYVQVVGNASEYRGTMQVVIKSLRTVPADSIVAADYLPTSNRNVEQMFERLKTLTETITHPDLKKLVAAFWADAELVRLFKTAPAAKKMHHAYLGGLLEHTLSMTLLADKIAGHYGGLDRDVLLVGTILHDIGKVRELSYLQMLDYSDEGRLLSHIVIGTEILNAKIAQVEGFPSQLATLLKHMIISHHGSREFGSPEPPKTVEAVLLHYIDEIDSRVNGIREFMAGEDPSAAWTSFHRLLERQFFRGEPNG